ncbi:MAG: polyprenyl synthetase family protein [Pseudomonadota bacterium]
MASSPVGTARQPLDKLERRSMVEIERDGSALIETLIEEALHRAEGEGSPPRLAAALRHAVLPGGARIRPRLAMSVAAAHGAHLDGTAWRGAAAGAAAIEMLHCASLVHDDLPCFDDADMRRGKPAVHRAFGERLAVLGGDALIVMAFETAALNCAPMPRRLVAITRVLAASVGMPQGIAAGQAWECEPHAELSAYQQAKTGALFAGATMVGALAAGGTDQEGWALFGQRLGEAYQVADDIRDVAGDAEQLGKPVGQDDRLGRPNAALSFGLPRAVKRLTKLVEDAAADIPKCAGRTALQALVAAETRKFLPQKIWELG